MRETSDAPDVDPTGAPAEPVTIAPAAGTGADAHAKEEAMSIAVSCQIAPSVSRSRPT